MPFPLNSIEFPKGVMVNFQRIENLEKPYSGEFISDLDKVPFFEKNPKLFAVELAKTSLLKNAFGSDVRLEKLTNGKPLPINGLELSLSHSGSLVALATSEAKVGIDLQEENPKLERIRKKFVSDKEETLIEQTANSFDPVHFLWCAKEAVFKIHGENLPFKDIEAESIQLAECGQVDFCLKDGRQHKVYYAFFDNFCFALAV